MERIENFFKSFQPIYVVEILLLTLCFFFTLNILRKNNAKLLILFLVIYTIAVCSLCFFTPAIPGFVGLILIGLFLVAIAAMFATEIKRAVWDSASKGPEIKHLDNNSDRNDAKNCMNEIIKAVQSMSKNNVGALIILANSNIPSSILDTGVSVNSEISSELMESIFFPKTPLHDGAMIINDNKIQAAGCFLPLSQEVNLPKELGTRHRAGIGITEAISVYAIIVSEETGVISVAHQGKIKRYADTEMLKNTLHAFYWKEKMN